MRLKAILVAGALALGCSSPGGSGPDGSDGVNGENGKDGADGAPGEKGADGAPGANGKDAASSGSRLKAIRIKAADGAEMIEPYLWYDSELSIRCAFLRLQDGVMHCAPLIVQAQYSKAFTDAQCTKAAYYALYPACTINGHVIESDGPTACPFEPQYAIRKLGAALPPGSPLYSLNPVTMACTSLQPTGDAFSEGAIVDPSEFVAAESETDP